MDDNDFVIMDALFAEVKRLNADLQEEDANETAAALIDSLTAQLTESQRRAQDARNELCQKCGRYRDAHKGACDGCRWMA